MRAIVARRFAAGALLLALTAASLIPASRVQVDGSIEGWFLQDDESLARYRAFRDRFGTDEFVLVAAFGPEVMTPDGLRRVERIRAAAATLPGCARTRWLTTARVAVSSGDVIDVGPLCRALPGTDDAVRALWDRALACSATRGMVSRDPPATAVLLELHRAAQDMDGKVALVTALRQIVAREAGPLEVVLSGPPVFDETFLRYTERDLSRLGPIALLLIFGVIAAAFRRGVLALVPLAVVGASLLWTFGLMGLLGFRLNPLSGNLVCVALAVGVADSIHLLYEYRAEAAHRSRLEAISRAAPAVFLPCLFCSLTTVAGMLSLATSAIGPIREFGLLAAASVSLAFLAAFTLGPVLLTFADPGPHATGSLGLGRLARMGRRTQLAILWGAVLLLALACAGIARLEVGVNPVTYFRPDDPLRRATERVDATLGGTANIELLVETAPAGLEDPARVAALASLRAALERERGVCHSQSLLDPLEDLHRAWGGEGLPSTPELLAQHYLLLESDPDLDRVLRPDHATARLSLRTRMSLTDRPLEVIHRIEQAAARPELAAAGLEVHVTGFVHLMATMYDYLLASQVNSTLLALALTTAAMAAFLRSLRLGLLALIPNVVPLVLVLGLMGALGIRLDVGTVMIDSVALGLVVDDTVHTLARLRLHLAAGLPVPRALERTLDEAGAPLIATSLALASGFLAIACGAFLVNVYFGLLTAIVIAVALASDLVLLPALVLRFPRLFAGRLDAPPATGHADQRCSSTPSPVPCGAPSATTSSPS